MVTAGQPLPAPEAMKMESRVHAPAAGLATEVLTRPGAPGGAGYGVAGPSPPHKN
ncbi:biotin/lipoyl-containing protein [Streptomyces sp. NPDC097727]|uniref:biotin/lipoyl-containing protein n=1 Tax=Streptomyces sp. NPDC097727 TaxID=3366092 RepID=UPI0038009CDB